MKKKVIVVGGGVAGMSAAHELLERTGKGVEFEVHVYERSSTIGGKARSVGVPPRVKAVTEGAAIGPSRSIQVPRELPGEHGFRFFPGFYRHLPDTMKGIPSGNRTVFDQLVEASRLELARTNKPPVVIGTRFPRTAQDVFLVIQDSFADLGISRSDVAFFASRIWQLMTSCAERRLAEYEKVTWWDFIDAERRSEAYRELLAEGASRSLLANNPKLASARTVGNTNIQLFLSLFKQNESADRVLNGPTSEVWLQPWFDYLQRKPNFEYHFQSPVTEIYAKNGAISGVQISCADAEPKVVRGDYYIFAVPLERMASLVEASARGADLLGLDPSLAGILKIRSNVAWMNGMQFFLYRRVPVVSGHCLFVDSPWSLTAISQAQFWKTNLATRGDGTVRDVLSVCISNWEAPGSVYGKAARDLPREQIAKEVWHQLKASLNSEGAVVLRDEDLCDWFLDPDIVDDNPKMRMNRYDDMEPLLINRIDTWRLRPLAKTGIPNLFLAADYVQTYTDVACMESANEAARRAVNAILESSGSTAPRCSLWELHEPEILKPLRSLDQFKFKLGLPWSLSTLFGFRPTPAQSSVDSQARYVERGGEQCHLPPYACNRTRMFGFVVKGSAQAIQKNVVDPCLNACSKHALEFRAFSDVFLVTFADAAEGRSLSPPDNEKGSTAERSFVVWTPVIAAAGTPKIYFYSPYIVVDNSWSMAAGREVYGFPKEFGAIEMPEKEAPPTKFAVSTLVTKTYGPSAIAEQAKIVEVNQILIAKESDGAGGQRQWATSEEAVREIMAVWKDERRSLTVPAWTLVVDLLETIGTHAVPQVFLKQFRDAADGTLACFQVLLEASCSVTGFRSGGILPGRFDLTAANFASHPVARDMGLEERQVPVELGFFVDFDFGIGLGAPIWRGP
jgi:uncharacterized protein with NAD-binding domain and iron-sulfur cluster